MSRPRLAAAAGVVLLAVAVGLLCGPLGDLFATSLPYQDPTPELLHQQAVDVTAARHHLLTRVWISGFFAVAAFAMLAYSGRVWLTRRLGGPWEPRG